MAFEPVQALAAAALGFASSSLLRWLQIDRELWQSRTESFCKCLEETAESAAEVWLRVADPDKPDLDLRRHQIKVQGLQVRLDAMLASLRPRFKNSERISIDATMNKLSDALTGGNFFAKNRDCDDERARLSAAFVSELIISTKLAADNSLTLTGYLIFIKERAEQRQKEALGEPFEE